MPDCNTCARKDCKGSIIKEKKTGRIKGFRDCPGYIAFSDLKVPLVERNSELYNKLQAITGKKKQKNINKSKKFKRVRRNDKNKPTKK